MGRGRGAQGREGKMTAALVTTLVYENADMWCCCCWSARIFVLLYFIAGRRPVLRRLSVKVACMQCFLDATTHVFRRQRVSVTSQHVRQLKQLTHWRPQESVARKSLITHVHVGLCVIHSVTVTLFRCISMPAGFRRHLLEKFVTLLSLKYVFFSRLMIISTFFFN